MALHKMFLFFCLLFTGSLLSLPKTEALSLGIKNSSSRYHKKSSTSSLRHPTTEKEVFFTKLPYPSPVLFQIHVQAKSTLALSMLTSKSIAMAVSIPSCLGFWKSEYGVSYGYGGAIALTAWLVFKTTTKGSIGYVHSLLHLIYGTRLALFLFARENFIPKFQSQVEKIESKAPTRAIKRFPFIISIALLYYWMSCPLFITSKLNEPFFTTSNSILNGIRGTLAFAAVGLLMQIVGDTQKSISKLRFGDKHLVTNGIYRFFRHPNYTGEMILWGSSALAGLLSLFMAEIRAQLTTTQLVSSTVGSILGFLGIGFVLAKAGAGLEKRQRGKYGYGLNSGSYQKWLRSSTPGIILK